MFGCFCIHVVTPIVLSDTAACVNYTNIPTAPGVCSVNFNYSVPTVTDNCASTTSLTLVSGPAPGGKFNRGKTTVRYRASDAGGLTANCTFTVTVVDTEYPTIGEMLGAVACNVITSEYYV